MSRETAGHVAVKVRALVRLLMLNAGSLGLKYWSLVNDQTPYGVGYAYSCVL